MSKSKGMIGKHHTEETKRKISGKLSKLTKGKKNPFYGKHHSNQWKKNLSERIRGENHPLYGKYHSEKTKKQQSEAKQGIKNVNWKGGEIEIICKVCGKKRNAKPAHIAKGWGKFCSHRCTGIWNIRHSNKKNTDIEKLIENELIKRGIPHTKQVALLNTTIVDFLLLHDIVIYCDGDYWHSLPKTKIKDIDKSFILTFHGYKVFRFKGSEIKKSAKKCIDKINKFLIQIREA